jgi:gliding motility-associated protein GldC
MQDKQWSDIEFKISLDSNRVPEEIRWRASGNPEGNELKDAKAILISVFNSSDSDTSRIDLWTKEFPIVEMDKLMFQTLAGLADTYLKATHNQSLTEEFRNFVIHFGKSTGILKEKKD